MKNAVLILLLCAVFSTAGGALFDKGRHELGGGLSIVHYSSHYGSGTTVYQLSPFYNYYTSRIFSVGPVLSLIGVEDDLEIDVGLRIGFGSQVHKSYLYVSPGIIYADEIGSYHSALIIPVATGIKTLLAKHFGVDTHFQYAAVTGSNVTTRHSFGFGVGFFGLL